MGARDGCDGGRACGVRVDQDKTVVGEARQRLVPRQDAGDVDGERPDDSQPEAGRRRRRRRWCRPRAFTLRAAAPARGEHEGDYGHPTHPSPPHRLEP